MDMVFQTLFRPKQRSATTIDMVLSHDGTNWTASNDSVSLQAESLEALDRLVEQSLRDQLDVHDRLDVFMAFDNEVIPQWIRPYMNHYFNRIIELPLRQT